MSVFTNRVVLIVTTIVAAAGSAADSNAGCGGGGGRSSGRLSIAYSRNLPHMRSHAPRNHYAQVQPTYRHAPVQPVYQQPVYQQPVYQPQVAPQPIAAQPALPRPAVMQPAVQPRIVAQPAATQPAIQPTPQPAAPTAEQSALQALATLGGGGSAIPQFAPAPAAQAAPHIGTWSATLPGENRVELLLNANGTFKWTANSRGSVSTFEGSFTVTNGRLTLVRSGDQQQLAGAWLAESAGGFRFKLDGQADAGLLFVRG